MQKSVSFVLGMLAVVTAVLAAVLLPVQSAALFERSLLETVNQEAVGMSESDLAAFARETMDYLRGRKQLWEPRTPFAIPQRFVMHMAEVRSGLAAGLWGLGISAVCLGLALLLWQPDGRCMKLGAACLLGLMAAAVLWALVDFNSFWYLLHRLFIPNGIFPASEPVMQLFPLQLFFRYLLPVGGAAAAEMALAYLLKRIFSHLHSKG